MSDDEQKNEEEQEETISKEEEYMLGWKRALADYENLKKTVAAEKQVWGKVYTANVVESFIPLYDYLVAATNAPADVAGIEKWVTGVKMVLTEFERILAQYGVKKIETAGKPFNPHTHESVGTERDETQPDGAVLKEMQAGFMLDDKIIRPAKVIINQL